MIQRLEQLLVTTDCISGMIQRSERLLVTTDCISWYDTEVRKVVSGNILYKLVWYRGQKGC